MQTDNTSEQQRAQRASGEVVPFPKGRLEAQRPMIVDYANAVYRNCLGPKGWIALRSFEHKTNRAVLQRWIAFGPGMIDAILEAANHTANLPTPAVFAPPACLFKTNDKAREADVMAGPVISVELDEHPERSRATLEALLGEPTLVVSSGGIWTAPDGAKQDKLHLYWRLKKPATTAEELSRLKRARTLATTLVQADGTNNTVVHPIRFPGSWHTKTQTPRLCQIIGGDPKREVELEAALALLEGAASRLVDASPDRSDDRERQGFKTPIPWADETLAEIAEKLPNRDWSWDEWNRLGMTLYDASHGLPGGLEAFHILSAKSDKYDPFATDERWSHYKSHPPADLAGNSLTYRMRQECDPTWVPSWPREHDAEAVELFALSDGPVDIFANGDPEQLSTLPANAVPPMLQRVIQSEARRKGAPEAFAAIATITTIGAAIGAEVRIQVRQHDDTWTEAPNLWSVLVADPGSGKSPIISAATKPLKEVDAKWVKTDQAAYNLWTAATKKRGKDAPNPGPEPKIRRGLVDDVTSEKLIRIFRDNPRGVLQTPDELAGLLGRLGAYSSGGAADRAHLLRSFDGESITADRVGNGTITAERASLSLLAGTQPDKLRELVKNLGSDGLLQRMIIVSHDGREREAVDEQPDREALDWYASMIRELSSAGRVYDGPVRLSPEGGAMMERASKQIKLLKHFPGAPIELGGHVEKWGKLLPRVVLILHLTRQMESGEAPNLQDHISTETVAMAVRLAGFFLAHSMHFYTTYFSAGETTSDARWIAGHLLTRPDLKIVSRKHLGDARKDFRAEGSRRLTSAMVELERFGWVWVNEREASDPKNWCIDDRIHVRFAAMAERERRERSEVRRKIIEAGRVRKQLNGGFVASTVPAEGIFG